MEELAVFFLFWLTFLVGIIAVCMMFFVYMFNKLLRSVKRFSRSVKSVADYWIL